MAIISYLLEHNRYYNILGIALIIAIAMIFSRKRSAIRYRIIIHALFLEFAISFAVLRTSIGKGVVGLAAQFINDLYACSEKGIEFVFGNLTNAAMPWGFIFAIKVLPIIIFFGALMSMLFHWGVIQRLVYYASLIIRPLLGSSGAETLCAVSNSFLGQTEAPLLVRNYLKDMTKSEMLVVMISGMATISGSILAVFVAIGIPATHLLSASVMAIPGSIALAKILYPETETPKTSVGAHVTYQEAETSNIFDAISRGTTDGLYLALNVAAMLISFISLIALLNSFLGVVSHFINHLFVTAHISAQIPSLSLSFLFSYLFAPFGYLLGFTGKEAFQAGTLLGLKISINELYAYSQMINMHLSERTMAILTYALCGFANFSSIGIQIGGIGVLVPEKRAWLCELSVLTLLGGSLSNLLSAMIAGLLL